jgi:CRP/FNR family transcriptional regulator
LRVGGEFFNQLRPAASQEMASMEHPTCHPENVVPFSEEDSAKGVFVILDGEVKLSINSSEGRRLNLSVARKGEILGLASTLSGKPYEMTAETLRPAKIAATPRCNFIDFLDRHPETYKIVTGELSLLVSMACEQLRTLGLSLSTPRKLAARLLLGWSDHRQTMENGTHFRFCLTHGEIGEFIGASRETVSRRLGKCRNQQLIDVHGSMVTIPIRTALINYAHCD